MSEPIVVSAVVVRDGGGRVLVVRKRGTGKVMLPGGKPEPGESAVETAVRECAEEVGVALDAADLTLLGIMETAAANEPGRRLLSTVFLAPWPADADPRPAAEIDHLEWVDPAAVRDDLAPLLTDAVLPALAALRQPSSPR